VLNVAPATGARLIDLSQVLSPTRANDPNLLKTFYRKPEPQFPLELLIKRDNQSLARLLFTVDLSSFYKDGIAGPLPSVTALPECVDTNNQSVPCTIAGTLAVPVENLRQWQIATNHHFGSLTLYLNGVEMSELAGVEGETPAGAISGPEWIDFALTRDLSSPKNTKAWEAILSGDPSPTLNARVGLGLDSRRWLFPARHAVKFEFPRGPATPWLLGFLTVVLVIVLAKKTDIARAPSTTTASVAALSLASPNARDALAKLDPPISAQGLEPPLSLSMSILLVWTLIVFLCFMRLGLQMHFQNIVINSTVLALLGFSGGSYLIARVTDATQSKAKTLDAALAQAITAFDPNHMGTRTAVQTALSDARRAGLVRSDSWVWDLLSETGASRVDLHRLQLLAFSLVYFILYLKYANGLLGLPDFSTNTLTLLGISTAGYVGMKFTSPQ
jgi:hypothetical protein